MTGKSGEAALQEHLFKIGHIAALWAKLEYEMNLMIWHLANVDIQAGACVTAQIARRSACRCT